MSNKKVTPAEALLHRLVALNVDYVFINSGTDYPPVIEAIAKAQSQKQKIPQIVVCPHENAAMGMANGYHFMTGKSQAVFVHTNVGLSNTATAAINASCNNVPTLIVSGRTPITEKNHFGCRDTPIGYGQEMRDQTALVRESVKWDFELRVPDQITDHIDRAYAIANSEPKGPVYLCLPREPLCVEFEVDEKVLTEPATMQPTIYSPNEDSIKQAAELIAQAKRPVILSQRGARSEKGFNLLSQLANQWGIPVVEFWATEVAISSEDPMSAGGDPAPFLPEADVVVIIDSLAPWMMSKINPPKDCKIIQMGPDPLFSKFPVRGYPVNVSLAGESAVCLDKLISALQPKLKDVTQQIKQRIEKVTKINQDSRKTRREIAQSGCQQKISKAYFSQAIGQLAEKYDATVIAELAIAKEFTGLTRYNSFYQEALSGGLGEALPIALGAQLANRDKLVIAALGDGCYMFSNPVVCHQIAEVLKLPVLIVIANNARWGAVANGTKAMFPKGYAAAATEMPAVELSPAPDFTKIAEASNALGIKVNHGNELVSALEKAVAFIKKEKRAVVIDVAYQ